MSILRQTLNTVHSNVTYPATMVANILLGYGDSTITHTSAIHNHSAFLEQYTSRSVVGHLFGDGTGGQDDVQADVTAAQPLTSFSGAVDDYNHRPAELEHLSPILMTSLYYKEAKCLDEDGQGVKYTLKVVLDFLPDHPQAHSHCLVRRHFPALPRFVTDALCHPHPGAQPEFKERFAAWALANFTAYRPDTIPSSNYCQHFNGWQASMGKSLDAPALPLLVNDSLVKLPNLQAKAAAASQATPQDPLLAPPPVSSLDDIWAHPSGEAIANSSMPPMVPLLNYGAATTSPVTGLQESPTPSFDVINHTLLTNAVSRASAQHHVRSTAQVRKELCFERMQFDA
jgi:hypothetical protein